MQCNAVLIFFPAAKSILILDFSIIALSLPQSLSSPISSDIAKSKTFLPLPSDFPHYIFSAFHFSCFFFYFSLYLCNICPNLSFQPYEGLKLQDLRRLKDMLIVETADMLQAPLFTAEALLRAHGMCWHSLNRHSHSIVTVTVKCSEKYIDTS